MEDRSYLDYEDAVLEVKGVSILGSTFDLSFEVKQGQIFGLFSENQDILGQLVSIIAGLTPTQDGQLIFLDQDISQTPVALRVDQGLGVVPAWPTLFPEFSVRENLMIGGYVRTDQRAVRQDLQKIDQWSPTLAAQMDQSAKSLAPLDVQMLLILRALMAKPRLIFVQLPSLALTDDETLHVFETLQAINRATDLSMVLASPLKDHLSTFADCLHEVCI